MTEQSPVTTKQEVLEAIGDFIWFWDSTFHVQIGSQYFHWKDPDYQGGDNSFVEITEDYELFRKQIGVPFGRSKGFHRISDYCGTSIEPVFLKVAEDAEDVK